MSSSLNKDIIIIIIIITNAYYHTRKTKHAFFSRHMKKINHDLSAQQRPRSALVSAKSDQLAGVFNYK